MEFRQEQHQQIPLPELEFPPIPLPELELLPAEPEPPEIRFDHLIECLEGPPMILDQLDHQQIASIMLDMENMHDDQRNEACEATPCRAVAIDALAAEESTAGSNGRGGAACRCAKEEDMHGCGRRQERRRRMHNKAERRRRSIVNQKLKELQHLLPNSDKLDKASVLDEAISHIRSLQRMVQVPMDPYAPRPNPSQASALQYLPVMPCMMLSSGSMATSTNMGLGPPPFVPTLPVPRACGIAPAPSATFRPSTTFWLVPPPRTMESFFPVRSLP